MECHLIISRRLLILLQLICEERRGYTLIKSSQILTSAPTYTTWLFIWPPLIRWRVVKLFTLYLASSNTTPSGRSRSFCYCWSGRQSSSYPMGVSTDTVVLGVGGLLHYGDKNHGSQDSCLTPPLLGLFCLVKA